MQYAHIRGWGKYLPTQVMTNEELARRVETDDEWIRTRTGIVERRIAGTQDTTLTMAIKAGREALAVAGRDAARVELVIVATSTPDRVFPSTACLVQHALAAQHAAAFDLYAACSGFIYALSMANAMLQTGAITNALVIGSETLTHILDWTDRTTCVLFGDGAGAFFLQADRSPGGLLAFASSGRFCGIRAATRKEAQLTENGLPALNQKCLNESIATNKAKYRRRIRV